MQFCRSIPLRPQVAMSLIVSAIAIGNVNRNYVKMTNLSQNIPLKINGVNYRIQLEFGATDSFGFSGRSQFHVYEGATGQGELLGTFLPR